MQTTAPVPAYFVGLHFGQPSEHTALVVLEGPAPVLEAARGEPTTYPQAIEVPRRNPRDNPRPSYFVRQREGW
jgi:hypothetical protein